MVEGANQFGFIKGYRPLKSFFIVYLAMRKGKILFIRRSIMWSTNGEGKE